MSQSKIKCIYFSHIFPRHGVKSEKRIAKRFYAICAERAHVHQAWHYEISRFELGTVYLLPLFTPDMQYSSDMLLCSSTSPAWCLLLDFKSSKREDSSIDHIHVKIPTLLHLNRVLKIFPSTEMVASHKQSPYAVTPRTMTLLGADHPYCRRRSTTSIQSKKLLFQLAYGA